MAGKPIDVTLTVFYVGSGGNTRDGRYFYSFDPPIVDVTEPDTVVTYTLSKNTGADFFIADLYANDVGMNLRNKHVGETKRSLSITNTNSVHQLVILSLLVMDGDVRVNCDPQMTNTPRPT